MIHKSLIMLILIYVFSPVLIYFVSQPTPKSIVSVIEPMIYDSLNDEPVYIPEIFVPQSLLKGEDMTMFYFRYIRPNLPDYNDNQQAVRNIPQKKNQRQS